MRKLFAVLVLVLPFFVSGCASTGKKIDPTALSDFKAGVTTKSEVVQRLGPPQSSSSTSDGTQVVSYYFSESTVNGATFIPVVGLFAGGSKGSASITTFIFDKNEILKSFTTTNSNHQYNMGSSGQN
jgi:outer membrane protein assembly factor BamE (lipoprotein component of BamABCDE complex)